LLLKQKRTFPSTVFSTYTMEEIWQLAQWKRYGSWPTALSNVAAFIGGKEIQLGVVWNVRVTPSCLGGTGALKNTHVFMR
jgi:hypothetical protein